MQEFFHIFAIIFFLFVTLLKFITVCQSLALGKDFREKRRFPNFFPDCGVFSPWKKKAEKAFCYSSVSDPVITMTACFGPLFPLSQKNFFLFPPPLICVVTPSA
jgi:hypothetical protein